MSVSILPPVSETDLHKHIHGLPLNLVIGPVQDCEDQLFPLEISAIAKAISKRRQQFATGRLYARQAMHNLGVPPSTVEQGAQREPIWQQGIRGSISHTDKLVASAVTIKQPLGSIGLDLEQRHRLGTELYERVFTPAEIAALTTAPTAQAITAFSAKEAIYKAVYPVVGRYIGFQEVEVDFDWAAHEFTARYIGNHHSNDVMHAGRGYISYLDQHVFTLFFVADLAGQRS